MARKTGLTVLAALIAGCLTVAGFSLFGAPEAFLFVMPLAALLLVLMLASQARTANIRTDARDTDRDRRGDR